MEEDGLRYFPGPSLRQMFLSPVMVLVYFLLNGVFHYFGWKVFLVGNAQYWLSLPYIYIFSALSVLCYAKAALSDPGWLLRGTAPAHLTGHPRYCSTCHLIRPERSKHCPDCNRCVARFDHHCPFVGNCIGAKNDPYFVGFLLCQWITLLLTLHIGFHIYWHVDPELRFGMFKKSFVMLQLLAGAFSLIVANTLILVPSLVRISLNVTTNECLNSEKYPWISFKGKYENRHDVGTMRNLYRFWTGDDTPIPLPAPNVKHPIQHRRPWLDAVIRAYQVRNSMQAMRQQKAMWEERMQEMADRQAGPSVHEDDTSINVV